MSIAGPQYSIVIPTYNRAKTLALTLNSVCQQTLSPEKYEILVVDDGSSDNTKEVVLHIQKNILTAVSFISMNKPAVPLRPGTWASKNPKAKLYFLPMTTA
ncbi:MAG: glycosyltransferase [bacterium]|nr:glycosyltransferase [bacterium]